VKFALLESFEADVSTFLDKEYRVRVRLDEGIGDTYALVIIRMDASRNAQVIFAGVHTEASKGESGLPAGDLANQIATEYGVNFVTTPIQARLLGGGPVMFQARPWDSTHDLTLLQQALELLGGAEQARLNGMSLRRLQGSGHQGAGGFFSASDNSINLFDAVFPKEADEWYQVGGSFRSGGVRSLLHEIGHALANAPAGGQGTVQDQFRTAMLQNWRARRPPGNTFPPPANIPLPTEYARTSWGEFFSESYSIYKVNPAFLQNPEYQYIYDFFAARYP
jgi:hypothetical protein